MLSQPGNGGRNVRKTKRDYYHIIVDVQGEKKTNKGTTQGE